MGYPVTSTFYKALDNGLVLSSNIISKQLRKHLNFSESSGQGQLSHKRQGIQSTTTTPFSLTAAKIDADLDPSPIPNKTTFIFATCIAMTGKLFSDPTGCFVVPYISGNNYILVMYNYDSNTIHAQNMHYRTNN